ncbi:MAG: hypothetical protein WC712_11330 [Candidatus Brocadiia bacterium]
MNVKVFSSVCVSLLLFSCAIAPSEDMPPALNIKETVLYTLDNIEPQADMVVVSPDHKRLALVLKKDTTYVVVLDGKESKPYDEVSKPRFSPDGSKCAFAAKEAGKWCIVENGKPGAKYDAIEPKSVLYSPDGRLAFAIAKGDKQCVVMGGRELKQGKAIGQIHFSGDGKHFAFAISEPVAAEWGPKYDASYLIVDTTELKDFESPMLFSFSPVGKRHGFIGTLKAGYAGGTAGVTGPGANIIIDGAPVEKLGGTAWGGASRQTVSFSEDCRHFGYSGNFAGDKYEAVIDGKRFGPYKIAFRPQFSPSGKAFGYFVETDAGLQVAVNGKVWTFREDGGGMGDTMSRPIAFSGNDSAAIRVKFAENGYYVAENGKALTAYKWVSEPVYSPKGELCYLASSEDKSFLVRDGKEEVGPAGKFVDVSSTGVGVMFSPAGDACAFIMKGAEGQFVILNGEKTYPLGAILDAARPALSAIFSFGAQGAAAPPGPPGPPTFSAPEPATQYTKCCFVSGNTLNLIARKDSKYIRYEIKVK